MGEEGETIRCLAALTELERLYVTLLPMEQTQGSQRHYPDVDAGFSPGSARETYPLQLVDVNVLPRTKLRKGNPKLGIRVLQPLVIGLTLQEVHVEGGYVVKEKTWERIQQLRGVLSLPPLLWGSEYTKRGGEYTNVLAELI